MPPFIVHGTDNGEGNLDLRRTPGHDHLGEREKGGLPGVLSKFLIPYSDSPGVLENILRSKGIVRWEDKCWGDMVAGLSEALLWEE